MNILQVMGCTSDQYSSMERYLVEKAIYCKEKGYQFYVVYENTPKSVEFMEDFTNAGGELLEHKIKSKYDRSFYNQIIRLIKEKDINIVHTYFTPTCHCLNFYLFLKGFKNVVRTAANLPVSISGRERLEKPYLRICYSIRHIILASFVKRIICRSEAVRDEYQKLEVSTKKLEVATGGVDTDFFKFSSIDREDIQKKINLNNTMLVLGVFCRLVKVKKIDSLIKIFKDSNLNENIKLLISGTGPEESDLRGLVRDLDLESKVKFLGHRDDINRYYSALDVFCLASVAEGMSNSILEAMSSELPVVASNIPSNRELIDEGKGGYLVSFEDPEAFGISIAKVRNRNVKRQMGQYNRKKVLAQYSIRSRVEKEFQIYDEIVS